MTHSLTRSHSNLLSISDWRSYGTHSYALPPPLSLHEVTTRHVYSRAPVNHSPITVSSSIFLSILTSMPSLVLSLYKCSTSLYTSTSLLSARLVPNHTPSPLFVRTNLYHNSIRSPLHSHNSHSSSLIPANAIYLMYCTCTPSPTHLPSPLSLSYYSSHYYSPPPLLLSYTDPPSTISHPTHSPASIHSVSSTLLTPSRTPTVNLNTTPMSHIIYHL
jgi:hypothetical protein